MGRKGFIYMYLGLKIPELTDVFVIGGGGYTAVVQTSVNFPIFSLRFLG